MVEVDRRCLLAGAGAGLLSSSSIARALAIDADRRHGSLMDVDHIVILMQENRSFDHYFGTLAGVRGFGDRFPIPSAAGPDRATVWTQHQDAAPETVLPFRLDTEASFPLMCAEGTPHTWPDAQAAWDEGRMSHWPAAKTVRSMGYYARADLPFQFALAEAFTLCDAYHCSIQTGTNSNRLFLWTGTNDPSGAGGGPAIGNSHDSLVKDGGYPEGYRWMTYAERLQAAGVSWRIYQDMADNFDDNPLAGFARFRDAHAAGPSGPDGDMLARGLSTRSLGQLRADVLAGKLPQVSYIVSEASNSEHPAASSPAQGADYTARVLDALTVDPKVWSRTILLVMFDENDGFFDHVPPPAPPSRDEGAPGGWAGASTVATDGEYHLVHSVADAPSERPALIGRPYGLGPRVPLYVISPWSRGGWVNSEVFDHISVIRLLERRFGAHEPNISAWRRTVCGDLMSAFDFAHPNALPGNPALPATAERAARAKAVPGRVAAAPVGAQAPIQAAGVRRSRALPYALEVRAASGPRDIALTFENMGQAGAVFHVYDRLHRDRAPRRYTVGASNLLVGTWNVEPDGGHYDLWVLGPNGFHRHFIGIAQPDALIATVASDPARNRIMLELRNPGPARTIRIEPMAYGAALAPRAMTLAPGATAQLAWPLGATSGWYDLALRIEDDARFLHRFAGRLETGRDSISDPAMHGPAMLRQPV